MSSNVGVSSLPPAVTPSSTLAHTTKVSSASKEFESLLIGQWLQGAETSFGSVPGGEEDQDAGADQMKSFGIQQLAKAITDAGGFGIATLIAKHLR